MMVQIWEKRLEERRKKRVELGILVTVLTGVSVFVASRQRRKGRETIESNRKS